ncbi:MAG: thioesterase domain-containing protein [Thiomonas sp.]|jgi:surfactin synthase thioesterase subunit|nr:thioesterase domain-containing protein [Thiomonas sp.]
MDLLHPFGNASAGPVRLVLFPHAGEGPAPYVPFLRVAAGLSEVWALRLPGREDWINQPPISALGRLVDAIQEQWRSWVPKPTVLLGVSFGSILVHELVLRIAAGGAFEALLRAVMVSAAAPCRNSLMPAAAHLPNELLLAAMAGRYARSTGVSAVDSALAALRAPALRADLAMVEVYQPKLKVALPLSLAVWRGDEDTTISEADLAAWRHHYVGEFKQRCFHGGHFFLQSVDAEVRQALAHELTCATAPAPGNQS